MAAKKKFRTIKEVYESGTPLEKPAPKRFKTMTALYRLIHEAKVEEGEPDVAIHAQEIGIDDQPEFIGNVPSSAYDKVRRAVLKNAKGGANEFAPKLTQSAGLSELGVDPQLAEILQTYIEDWGKFKSFMDKKAELTVLGDAITGRNVFTMDAVMIAQMKKTGEVFLRKGEEKAFVFALARLAGDINRVGVGPGELMCTIISNATKGETGDLSMPGLGDVEFKATAGRLGINNYVNETGIPALERWLGNRALEETERDTFATPMYATFVAAIKKKTDKFQSPTSRHQLAAVKAAETDPNIGPWLDQINQILNNVPTHIDNREPIPDAEIDVLHGALTAETSPFKKVGTLDTLIGPYREKARHEPNLVNYNAFWKQVQDKTFKISTTKGYAAIFLQKQEPTPLTHEEYTEALLEMRSEPIGESEHASLLEGVRQEVKQEDVDSLVGGNLDLLKRIGAAIQIACYAYGHFNYICFSDIGSNKKQGTMKSVGINCEGGDLGGMFVSIYQQMNKHKWNISLSVDAANKGFQVTPA
jgi:hypothetical protein